MFFYLPVLMLPLLAVRLIYFLAALLPAVILLRYIYRHDTVEKEPAGLLVRLLLMGVLAAVASMFLEGIAQRVLDFLVDPRSPFYTIYLAFLVVAAVEEGTKFYLLKRSTWNHPAFNYRFDAVVYAVFVSLGFAALENFQYVWRFGLSVALPRALLAVPGHMSFAVSAGVFYGRAKAASYRGDPGAVQRNLCASYLAAVLLHGVYDACAMFGTMSAAMLFLVFVLAMFLWTYHLLKRESAADRPL